MASERFNLDLLCCPRLGYSKPASEFYNSTNQRTKMTLADGSWWEYRYDALGQVISGKR